MPSLDPALKAQLETGQIKFQPLVRIDLPGKTAAYHAGGRPFTWAGLEYLPNRFMKPDGLKEGLGNEIAELKLIFSDVPTPNPDDAIASIETYNYMRAPVTVSYLGGNPITDKALGVLITRFYMIADVQFKKSPRDENGRRTVTLEITLKAQGAREKGFTPAKASTADQQYHNDATDTFYEYAAVAREWQVEFGQR